MYYVYIIKSTTATENHFYVGYTNNLGMRLKQHNSSTSFHTKKYGPWELIFCAAFQNKIKAIEFEKYLKSHSGRIFMQKRLF